ncbi:MAG: acyl carrier protein [Saprospiraceae bacterium]|jgi:acyl carrier protein|uniref:acyl carrier protein n=1 Tax=Candidatus Brachybacter algidus TaxID=2982024 RepID=UPI001B44386C|nr:phosphopantetheine-binding protein [Candidatus Brachybacter algidus]MBP7306838.1 hypothetical protein [Saprospiraceae bacterium]MBK6371687.1 acyl carrier protein [Candidatus Brachybacter algidus]MBK6448945.1 acyl carrier protein [Candidatus Brachybacter algidus]MBK8357311.1 acyl carrier protein [Candidatus Brachybacter algidus]MBK8604735.1 acyl carrier protein [Candidatus Brachybacter algidus]
MDKINIIDSINSFLSEEFEVDKSLITPQASIKETLGLDSLDFVDLVVLIERNFGFKMAGEEFTKLKTFDDFHGFVYDHMQQKIGA